MNLLPKILSNSHKPEDRQADLYQTIVRREAKKGGQLFGPIPSGHRREFFCLDRHTWIWHEEWIDSSGQRQIVTTRYEIRPNGILKSQGNNTYQKLSREELKNFYRAAKLYRNQVGVSYQRALQAA
ncbi:MAG TPA: hypothetical protein VLG37_00225 [Candidatus Saccharimonadales bacterium]|nr:hypothetical protein [Candidatus Saccharimonadales bacterium]